MKLGDGSPLSPIASATVLMLRDTTRGLEVFLLKRHGLSDVLGGAYVFPGGKMDRQDVDLVNKLDLPLGALHFALGEPELCEAQAAALYVAAIREVFEETGLLYAEVGVELARDAWTTLRQGRSFAEVLDFLETPMLGAAIVPWSRWITPVASLRARKHFDARFFVAAVLDGQEPVHDQHETTESVWMTPREALREYWQGRIQFAPPQIMSLAHLSRYADVDGVLTEARSRKPTYIHPEVFEQGGMPLVCFPGDERHSVATRLIPGPLRLCWRNDRYEPVGGLESLFQ